jgi:hypothetical protein
LLARGIKEFRLLASPNAFNPADFANPPANFNLTGFTEILGVTELAIGKAGQNATTQQFALTGDYNDDGAVDAADYTVWRDTLGQSGTGLAADGNRDNRVDGADYSFWQANFGDSAGSGSAQPGAMAVPEPAAMLLCALGLVVPTRRIRCKIRSVLDGRGPRKFRPNATAS